MEQRALPFPCNTNAHGKTFLKHHFEHGSGTRTIKSTSLADPIQAMAKLQDRSHFQETFHHFSWFLVFLKSEAHLSHDLRVRILDGVGPLHRHQDAPDLDLPAHQPAPRLSGGFMVFKLQEAKASVLLLVIRLMVQNDVVQAVWTQRRFRENPETYLRKDLQAPTES